MWLNWAHRWPLVGTTNPPTPPTQPPTRSVQLYTVVTAVTMVRPRWPSSRLEREPCRHRARAHPCRGAPLSRRPRERREAGPQAVLEAARAVRHPPQPGPPQSPPQKKRTQVSSKAWHGVSMVRQCFGTQTHAPSARRSWPRRSGGYRSSRRSSGCPTRRWLRFSPRSAVRPRAIPESRHTRGCTIEPLRDWLIK